MSLPDVGVVAGMISTSIFVLSYLPMLAKAGRTRDLGSYSATNLVLANVGNAIHSVYVFSLPVGPLWALHTFYVLSTALMLFWYLRYARRRVAADRVDPSAADGLLGRDEVDGHHHGSTPTAVGGV